MQRLRPSSIAMFVIRSTKIRKFHEERRNRIVLIGIETTSKGMRVKMRKEKSIHVFSIAWFTTICIADNHLEENN